MRTHYHLVAQFEAYSTLSADTLRERTLVEYRSLLRTNTIQFSMNQISFQNVVTQTLFAVISIFAYDS